MGSSSSTPSNTTTSQYPWQGSVTYLLGRDGRRGVFPEAESYFNRYSQLNPQQQTLNQLYTNILTDRSNQSTSTDLGAQFISGRYDPGNVLPNINQLFVQDRAGIKGPGPTPQIQLNQLPQISNYFNRSQGNFGRANPTNALEQSLSGDVNLPVFQAVNQANINDALRGYSDAVSQIQTRVLPQISDEAFASGGYGGSRQGVAEGQVGTALGNQARDLGIALADRGNQLYGAAYESAQGRASDAARFLSGLSGQFAQQEAGDIVNTLFGNQANQLNYEQLRQNKRTFNAEQQAARDIYNAQTALGYGQYVQEAQERQRAAAAANALQGVGLIQQGQSERDNIFNQLQAILGLEQAQYQDALNQYAQIISPGAAYGGTSASQIPIFTNTGGQIAGGALGIAGLLGALGE